MEILEEQKISCAHCGEDCEDTSIQIEDKHFCCNGCKTVFEILAEKDMCMYYDLDKQPGIKLKNRNFGEKYAYLDNPEIAEKIADFASDTIFKIQFLIPTIHCSSCIWLLENLYKIQDGILQSRVNFIQKRINLVFNPQIISLRKVVELLSTLGYEPQINLESLQHKTQNTENRKLFLKIGITGFCLGNLMLFSFPDYVAIQDWVGNVEKSFFGILSIFLALPIILYSSEDYFKSAWKSLKVGIINLDVPISLGILTLFGRSVVEIAIGIGGGYLDSLAGLVFFLLIGKWFQSKTYQSFSFERDYLSYFPLAVSTWNGNDWQSKIATNLQKGDKIKIKNQELIPTDCVLASTKALIDYSFVTGEAEPVVKSKGDYIYAGGKQVGESIELEVQKEVSQSYLTQLWNNDAFLKPKAQSKIEKQIQQFGFYFTYITLLIALLAGLYWSWADSRQVWNVFTAVLIIACPCALTLAMPFVMGNLMRIFGRNLLYLKNADVISTMVTINHVVFDKTGTITQAESSKIQYQGKPLCRGEANFIKSLCSHSTHPLSKKIVAYLADASILEVENYHEIPHQGIVGEVANVRIQIGKIQQESNELPHTEVGIWIEEVFIGKFEFQHQYRGELKQVLNQLKSQNIRISVISGDKASEQNELKKIFGEESTLFFNQSPQQKLDKIAQWQAEGSKILMIGDGLNDAGALQQSDVGIAIAEDTNTFVPSCSAILDARSFQLLPQFIQLSQKSITAVKLSFLLSLVYNFFGLSFAVSGILYPWVAALFMPLSSASVVLFAVWISNRMAKNILS